MLWKFTALFVYRYTTKKKKKKLDVVSSNETGSLDRHWLNIELTRKRVQYLCRIETFHDLGMRFIVRQRIFP